MASKLNYFFGKYLNYHPKLLKYLNCHQKIEPIPTLLSCTYLRIYDTAGIGALHLPTIKYS
jgi:hypothetical protein